MASLTELFQTNEAFLQLPATKREIYMILAAEFEENDLALHLSPTELSEKLGKGNKQQWQEFLSLEPVNHYIKQQMAFNAKVASRKAFESMTRQAMSGDTTAAKQINELAGIYNSGDANRVVVLHQIKRAKPIQEVINHEN